MEPVDHGMTASYGGGVHGPRYAPQRALLGRGQTYAAFMLDVADARAVAAAQGDPRKYDGQALRPLPMRAVSNGIGIISKEIGITMAAEGDWTVLPGEGLGRLNFGMSPEQVDALSDTYGAVTGRRSDSIPDDILRDTLEKFGDGMSEEDKQALIAAYAESAPPSDSVTETRGNPGLVLRYEADRLVEIMPAKKQRPLYLDGTDLLSLSALEALGLLERLNGGPGRYSGTEAAFDKLAISVEGFCVTDRMASVRTLDETDERFQGRTMTLRSKPYLPKGEMDRFIVDSVLE